MTRILRKGTKEYEERMVKRDERLIKEFLEFRKNPPGRKMRIKRKVDYKPKPDGRKSVKRKAEMDEEIINLCQKIRAYTNKIEGAIKKDKQELELDLLFEKE